MKNKYADINSMPPILTAQDIADYLNIARKTVYEHFKLPPDRGGMKNFSIGTSRRVMKEDLVQWIELKRKEQDAEANSRIHYIERGERIG